MNLPFDPQASSSHAPRQRANAARVAVLLPCYNEEAAIAQTVAGFRAALPGATIFVYDNNSSDRTCEVAAAAGAVVRRERMQGKGNVVRRMFADVEADIYVMADGDATYDPAAAPELVRRLVDEQLDMVVGARKSEVEEAYRRGHRLGNRLFTGCFPACSDARSATSSRATGSSRAAS
jgi:glycosyltransferase involved in cell wall biosynthesis